MNNEIATLGLAVDSRAVVAATTALNSLAAAARPAAQGATDLQNAAARTATAMQAQNSAVMTGSSGMLGQRMALRGLATDMALLGTQFGSVAGMAGTLYLGNEAIFRGFGNVRSAMSALLTPSNLLIGGFAAAAVGAFTLYESIKTSELAMGDLSDRTGVAVQALHAFESVAAFKGIATADFIKTMEKFGDASNLAIHNMGSLAEVFKANNVQAGSLDDNLLHAADIIASIPKDADKLRMLTLLQIPATAQWAAYLSQGSANLKQAAADAVKFGGTADEQLIAKARKTDEEWGTFWHNFAQGGKQAFVSVETGFSDLIDWFNHKAQDFHPDALALRLQNAFSDTGQVSGNRNALQSGINAKAEQLRTGSGPAVNPDDEKRDIQNAIPRLSMLGKLPPAKQAQEKETDKTREADRERDSDRRAA